MTKTIRSLIMTTLVLPMLVACTRENPNPELLDPIYQDFQREVSGYTKAIEEGHKALDTARKELGEIEPRTLDHKLKLRAVEKAEAAIQNAEQKLEYFKIRADLRKAYGRKDYKLAFKEGKPWPDPKEYEAFKINKALVDADRSWSSRVPKTMHQEMSADAMKKAPEE